MASNKIKGLTVEIGGDTTKLGKALENVNKKSSDLSGELREINQLLKLDPGNTDLLAQKQKVLAAAVSNTADKLGTLKEAERQVQQQFERGEVSEAQVRALQREIINTTRRMEEYQNAAKSASDVSTGLGDKLASIAKTGLAAVATAATAAVGALIGSAEATREYRTAMGTLDTAFETAGHNAQAAAETYQALQGVLGDSGQAVEAANHLAQLADNEEDLAKWTDIATGVYATFGVSLPVESLTEAANETAKTGAITGALADALNWAGVNEDAFQASLDACTTEQERQALITETLNGLYSEAADAYRETNAEVIRANEANEAWAATMADVGGAIEPILSDVKFLGASLVSDLLPGVNDVAEGLRGMLNGDAGAAENVGEALSGLITQLLSKVTELAPTLVQVATSVLTTLTTSLITMLPQLVTTGVQLITTLITGMAQALPQIIEALAEMIPQLVDAVAQAVPQITSAVINGLIGAIPALLAGAVTFLLAIVDAIPQLINQLVPQIPVIVNTIIDQLIAMAPALLAAAIELLWGLIQAIPEIVAALVSNLPVILSTITGVLSRLPALLGNILSAVISRVVTWASNLAAKGKQAAKDLLNSVVNGIKTLPDKVKSVGSDLVKGLWNGIKDMTSWVKKKIKGFTDDVLNGIKSFFGVKSPSRETAWIGRMLDEGLAQGVMDNADAPLDALDELSSEMLDEAGALNGLTLERSIRYGVSGSSAQAQTGVLGKLDSILAAIERGQVLLLDGDAFVGATADRYDQRLGQNRILAARGAM